MGRPPRRPGAWSHWWDQLPIPPQLALVALQPAKAGSHSPALWRAGTRVALDLRPRSGRLAGQLTDRPARDPFGSRPNGSESVNGLGPASVAAGSHGDKDAGASRSADCMASMRT